MPPGAGWADAVPAIASRHATAASRMLVLRMGFPSLCVWTGLPPRPIMSEP